MRTLFSFTTPPHPCGYLPDRDARMRYQVLASLSPAEYGELMRKGWRKFGASVFRPECVGCRACQPLRVDVARFQPSRTQKRVEKLNAGSVEVRVGAPVVTPEKLALYDRFHAFQTDLKGWPGKSPETPDAYAETFVDNPFPVEEWCYHVGEELVGVGYVDVVPGGLSAIYFFHDPDHRDRSLGTLNVLRVIRAAAERGVPHLYLGYYVAGCRSLEYKGRFGPNEVLDWATGEWVPFLDRGAE